MAIRIPVAGQPMRPRQERRLENRRMIAAGQQRTPMGPRPAMPAPVRMPNGQEMVPMAGPDAGMQMGQGQQLPGMMAAQGMQDQRGRYPGMSMEQMRPAIQGIAGGMVRPVPRPGVRPELNPDVARLFRQQSPMRHLQGPTPSEYPGLPGLSPEMLLYMQSMNKA